MLNFQTNCFILFLIVALKQSNKMRKYLLYTFFFLLFSLTVGAQELRIDKQHKGVVNLKSGYKIFPENRFNNSLYNKDNQFLFSIKNKTILDVFNYQKGRFLILKNLQNKTEILYQKPNASFEFKFIAPKYGLLKTDKEKSLFYYDGKEIIKKNLPYRSADGFVHNQKDVLAFYRIIEYTPKKTAEGQDVYVFKISFLKDGADKHINHSEKFKDTQATLSLLWKEAEQLTIILSNQQEFKIPIP